MKTPGIIIWFTGLSGSGKTTIGTQLTNELKALGKSVLLLDGDQIRAKHKRTLSFSREDIMKNNRNIMKQAEKLSHTHSFVIVCVIMPFQKMRAKARQFLKTRYVEIFVDTPLSVCISRDAKGLYKKALLGEIKQLIGIDPAVPYERPEFPDIVLHADKEKIDQQLEICMQYLKRQNYL